MQRKLPIVETAIDGLLFGVKNVWTAIRLGWAPLIVFIAVAIAACHLVCGALPIEDIKTIFHDAMAMARQPASTQDIEQFLETRLDGLDFDKQAVMIASIGATALCLLGALVFVPLYVVLSRAAANGDTAPGGFFYWRWGQDETRTLIACLVFIAITVLVPLGIGALGAGLSRLAVASGNVLFLWVPGGMPVFVFVVTLWILVRVLMIVPSTAIEGELNLRQAVRATGGNEFPLLGSMILFGLMIGFTVVAATIVLFVTNIAVGGGLLAFGANAQAAGHVGIIAGVVNAILLALVAIATQVAQVGWSAKAWAALRPDGVRACGTGGPGDGEICAL